MADPRLMDRMFHRILQALVETGRAPHYAELARAVNVTVEEGRRLLLLPLDLVPQAGERAPRGARTHRQDHAVLAGNALAGVSRGAP